MAEEAIGRRSLAALCVLANLASEVSSSKKRLGKVNTSPVDGFWRPDFAGAPHGEQCHCSSRKSGRSASAPALARQPFSRQTAHRRLSGAHRDRSQSHRQWLAVTAPAGRAYAVERVRPTCRAAPRCCQTKQVPKKGVEGRRREARRRPKKLRFISRGQKALAHPSLLPLNRTVSPRHMLSSRESAREEAENSRHESRVTYEVCVVSRCAGRCVGVCAPRSFATKNELCASTV